jgi:Outer membrane protein beta-barrel domain
MRKSLLSSAGVALVLAVTAAANAQPTAPPGAASSCPPGTWFCAEAPQQRAEPAGQPVQKLQPLPDPEKTAASAPEHEDAAEPPEEAPPPPAHSHKRRRAAPPPVVVYEPGPPPVARRLEAPPPYPPPYEYVRPHREPWLPAQEWGVNLHFAGALIGNGSQGNAGMGGAGAGLRFKPARSFGLEADLDFAGGDHDYQGDKRSETAFMLNGLFFLNPRSHAQVYLLAGFGWSGAHVTCDACATPLDAHYNYFGGQVGAGLELRLGRVLAFNADIRGFIRGRTDDLAQRQPEFQDPANCYGTASSSGQCRSTNTSGGGLLTAGMTLYF